MKSSHILLWLVICLYSCKKESPGNTGEPPVKTDTVGLKNYSKDITVANWNIEWFGDAQFPGNPDQQEANAARVLKYLNADLLGLCEIVDTARFGRMVRNTLGDEFRYIISPYPAVEQKLAVVYNRHIFRNAGARPFVSLTTSAAYNFSNGRFPFLFTATMVVNGLENKVNLVLLHAKAGATLEDYNRRKGGAMELKDTLDAFLNNANNLVIGDYNDNFNGSITSNPVSPYQNFLNDKVNYLAITNPLNVPGFQSTLKFANSVIDQQIVAGGFKKWYVSASAKIRTDVTAAVPDYMTNSTSDHYPVTSMYHIVK